MPASRRTASRANATTASNKDCQDKAAAVQEKPSERRKRAREVDNAGTESEPSPPKKTKVPTTDPTPNPNIRRSARSSKPTTKALPPKKKRLTKAEAAAARAAVEEGKRQKEAAVIEAERQLAQLNAEDTVARAEAAERRTRRLSDIELEESAGEEFVGFNEVSSSPSDEEEGEETNYKMAAAKLKALELEMKILQEAIDGGSKKKRVEGGKKKLTKGTSAYASGLLPDSRLHAAQVRSKKASPSVIISAGGLEDADADATKPYPERQAPRSNGATIAAESGPLKRDLSCQNTLVSIVPEAETQLVKKAIRQSAKASNPEKKVALRAKSPAVTAVKTEDKENHQTTTGKRLVITTNNVRVNDLPDFAKDQKWKKVFLPTLYDKFFSSEEPFGRFAKGTPAFIASVQEVVKVVYPSVSYQVSAREAVHALAYNRINEKRSLIGSSALEIVEKYISALQGEKAVRDWLLWAARPDGPIYWKEPVAPDAPLDPKNKKYIKPAGPLMSTFIINLVGSNLRAKSGSVLTGGRPLGLVALVMAAFERAVHILLHPPPPDTAAPEFSSSTYGSKVEQCVNSLKNFSENQWKEVLDACSGSSPVTDPPKDEEYNANLSFMDHRRANLFNFSSPIKG